MMMRLSGEDNVHENSACLLLINVCSLYYKFDHHKVGNTLTHTFTRQFGRLIPRAHNHANNL